uniref:Uncharacterized protein n=1 Tax=Rhizophora mucronata TaxID=61149 RepID=A0A2P2NPR5_RHIMU
MFISNQSLFHTNFTINFN